jgi:hypothetical protein
MTLDDFCETVRLIISQEGYAAFLPTACYPTRREIKVLTGLPPSIDPEKPVLDWASKSAQKNEEFLVAFKVDAGHFKIIRRVGPFSEDEIYALQR